MASESKMVELYFVDWPLSILLMLLLAILITFLKGTVDCTGSVGRLGDAVGWTRWFAGLKMRKPYLHFFKRLTQITIHGRFTGTIAAS